MVLVASACGTAANQGGEYAVGTYIGGGSYLFVDHCRYVAGPAVFAPSASNDVPSTTPAPGPRFITAPGKIKVLCPAVTLEAEAFEPTGVAIVGPETVRVGTQSERITANFVAGSHKLRDGGQISWELGKDCAGVARLGPIRGAQDTGGEDRGRTLIAIAKGTCTLLVTMETGLFSHSLTKPKVFKTAGRVRIE